MARLRIPAVAIGFLLFIGAGLLGLLTFFLAGARWVGLRWAIVVFLGVLLAAVAVAVVRSDNESSVEQP